LEPGYFLDVFQCAGVRMIKIPSDSIRNGIPILELLTEKTNFLTSKSEARKLIQGNGLSVNKTKIGDINLVIDANFLLSGYFLLLTKGKKNHFLVWFTDDIY
jgi:tyrosyl-tRNA synthetase